MEAIENNIRQALKRDKDGMQIGENSTSIVP